MKKPNLDRGNGPQLSPLRENSVSRPPPSRSTTTTHHPRQQKQVAFQIYHRSMSPIANNENVDSSGFSKAELHDLQESFKLFDVYGEGSVQVGDLQGILEVLQQEQQEHESAGSNKYPHLETLLDRLSELSDEDILTMDDYIQLMASTTISNAIMIENGNNADDNIGSSSHEHFARVFRLFDTDGKGYITQKDLEQIAVDLGEHDMTRGELQEMIDRALGGSGNINNKNNNNNNGGDGEKRVGIDEFTRMMTMSLFPSNDAGGQ
jgi:Ca2+-binding EF-hand superfamily protein